MTKLEKIEAEIKDLSHDEFKQLGDWFAELQADLWDEQIERDAKAGKLDKMIAEAKEDLDRGRVTPL